MSKYSDVFKTFSDNESKARQDKGIQKVIQEIKNKEEELPGTVSTMKKIIIEAITNLTRSKEDYVNLKDIQDYVLLKIKSQNLNYAIKNFKPILRKCIYVDLVDYERGSYNNRGLFETKEKYSGLFRLTENGRNYKGR